MSFVTIYSMYNIVKSSSYILFILMPFVLLFKIKKLKKRSTQALFAITITYEVIYILLTSYSPLFYNKIKNDDVDYFYNTVMTNENNASMEEKENIFSINYSFSKGESTYNSTNTIYVSVYKYSSIETAKQFIQREINDPIYEMKTKEGNFYYTTKYKREYPAFLPPPPIGEYCQELFLQKDNFVIVFIESFNGPRMVTKDAMELLLAKSNNLEYWLNNDMGFIYDVRENKIY